MVPWNHWSGVVLHAQESVVVYSLSLVQRLLINLHKIHFHIDHCKVGTWLCCVCSCSGLKTLCCDVYTKAMILLCMTTLHKIKLFVFKTSIIIPFVTNLHLRNKESVYFSARLAQHNLYTNTDCIYSVYVYVLESKVQKFCLSSNKNRPQPSIVNNIRVIYRFEVRFVLL